MKSFHALSATTLVVFLLSFAILSASERPEPKSDRSKTTKWVATMLMEENFDALNAAFSSTLQVSLSAEKMAQVMSQVHQQIGKLESVGEAHARTLRGMPAGEVICKAEHGRLVVQVVFDDEEIEGLWVVPGQ